MGRLIEEHIAQLKKLKSFHNGSYGESINYALDIMHKYQKIKEIVQHWIDEDLASESPSFADSGTIEDIIEVIEDGKTD